MTTAIEALAGIKQTREEFKSQVKGVFEAGCLEVFQANPALKSFGWNQYTPYFNDGDECTFSAQTDYPVINGKDSEDILYADGSSERKYVDGSWIYPDGCTEEEGLVVAVVAFLDLFDDADLEDIFGNHISVTVSINDGVVSTETEGYDHE